MIPRPLVAALAAVTLAGCAGSPASPLDDGYQLGDLSALQTQYCATAEPRQRAVLLALMYRAGVTLPPSGVCTEAVTLLPEAELAIDVEQAERDRARFEERMNEDRDPASAADLPRAE